MATYEVNQDAKSTVKITTAGPQGPIGITYRGDHVAGTVYQPRDAAFNANNGNSYYWPGPGTTTLEPLASNGWQLLSTRGAVGPQGPQGIQGIQGEKGLVWRGAWAGTTAYAVDNAVTYLGSSYRRIVAGTTATAPDADTVNWELISAKGDKGNTGTSSVGTTTTGAPGTAADVTNTGTPEAGIFNFTIPRGDKGEKGLVWRGPWAATTAYAVDNAVTYAGSSYRRLVAGTTATAPDADTVNWELLSAKGDQGIQGPQGIQGIQGETGATGLNWRGAWSSTTDYVADDAVGYNGASWFANIDPPVGEVPSDASTYWQLLASQGATGPQGVQGIQGEQGIQGIQGVKGDTGATGPQGPRGLTHLGAWSSTVGYVIDDAVTYAGSSWRAIRANTNVEPVEGLDWTLLASKGDPGSGSADLNTAQTWSKAQTFAPDSDVVPTVNRGAALTRGVSNKALTANVATLTTSVVHNFVVGKPVTVSGVDATFDGTYTIDSIPSTTTFTYAKTAADVVSAAATGTANSYAQTSNLQEWQDSAGTAIARISSNGLMYEGSNRVWSAGNVPATMVTTDTEQNIYSAKTFWHPHSIKARIVDGSPLVPNPSAALQIPYAGFWHDLVSFNNAGYNITQETTADGVTWTNSSVNMNLFSLKENQSLTVATSTQPGVRWTFSDISWSNARYLVLGHTWASPRPNGTVVVESSVDAVTWTQRSTSTYDFREVPTIIPFQYTAGDAYLRISITWNSGGDVRLSSLRLLTTRWGDQGKGRESEFPYTWSADKKIGIGLGSATPSYALHVRGTAFNESSAAATSVSIAKAAPSQSANIQEWQDSAGTALSSITADGTLKSQKYVLGSDLAIVPIVGGQSVVRSWWGLQLRGLTEASVNTSAVANVGGAADAHVLIPMRRADAVGLSIIGSAAQTSDLQQWQDNTGVVLSRVANDGTIWVGKDKLGAGASDTEIMTIMGAF